MFEVLGKPSVPCKPCEGALDDPAFGQDDKLGNIGPFDDFQEKAEQGLGPIERLSRWGRRMNRRMSTRWLPRVSEMPQEYATTVRSSATSAMGSRCAPRTKSRQASHTMFAGPPDVLGFEKTFDAAYQA